MSHWGLRVSPALSRLMRLRTIPIRTPLRYALLPFRGWILLVAACGCGAHTNSADHAAAGANHSNTRPIDPWVLTCDDPAATEPALLWNGQIGLRLGRDGGPLGPDGKRLPMFVLGGYDKSSEEKRERFDNPLQSAPSLGDIAPSVQGCTNYT